MQLKVPDFISRISPYKPGKPIEELERERGISGSIKLASNENPLGPSPKALAAIRNAEKNLHRYPDGGGYYMKQKLSEKLNVSMDAIVPGNGSDDIIGMLTRAFLLPGHEAIMTRPSFLMYEIMVRAVGATPVMVPLKQAQIDLSAILEHVTSETRMIFITQPNNPTGQAISTKVFQRFLRALPGHVLVVVDEAYIEFMRDPDGLNSLSNTTNPDARIVTLRTFSKAYGLAGLRVGYGVMHPEVADVLHRVRQPFNVNSLAQAAAVAAIDDQDFLNRTIALIHEGVDFLYAALDRMGLTFFKTEANFLMIHVAPSGNTVYRRMLEHGVIVRDMASYDYPEYIRVSIGLPEENRRFVETLALVTGN